MARRSLRLLLNTCVVTLCAFDAHAETAIPDPCAGSLLAIIDRPTVADNPCVVPPSNIVIEGGVQRSTSRYGGWSVNFPEAIVRAGFGEQNELVIAVPNYYRQNGTSPYLAGVGAAIVGLKHELGYTEHWLGAVEALATLPSGSTAFGSQGLGGAVNGVVSNSVSENVGLSLMLGVSSQSLSAASGGSRYVSVNPDLVVTWSPKDGVQLFGEVYGQSRTGPGEGSGWNADGGIQFLVSADFVVDVEVGTRLAGNLGGFSHYYGAGFGVRF
jgi:hypothetical protein